MARGYGRIRPVPDQPVDVIPAITPDFRPFAALAGLCIALGFAIFVSLGYGVFYTFHDVIPSVTASQDADVTAVVGTVELQEPGAPRPSIAQAGLHLREGDVLRTRDNSRALVTLFDKSTITLYPGTAVIFNQLRANRFGSGLHAPPRTIIDVRQTSGRTLFGVAHLNPIANLAFTVHGGNAAAALSEGSYIVKVSPTGAFDLMATRGSSVVSAAGGKVTISGGERTEVRPGQPPDAAILAPEDLVTNGSFTQVDAASGKPLGWDYNQPAPELGDVPGVVKLTSDGSFSVVRFTRTKSTYHAEQGIRQVINQDVTDYNVVRLDLRFKVFSQSLSGGGDQGSEYPLMVKVNYTDVNGAQQQYVRGFYVQNDKGLPVTNGQQVPAGQWTELTDASGLQLQQLSPRPQFIQSVEVVASGHDYDSEIQKVSLVIE